MGFSRQEYWSELPFPTPGDRPYPGIKPMTPALAGGFFTDKPPGKSYESWGICKNKDFDSADLLWEATFITSSQAVCAVGARIKLWAARNLLDRSDLQWWVSLSSEELGFLSWIRNFYAIYRVYICFPCWVTSYHKCNPFKQLPFIILWCWLGQASWKNITCLRFYPGWIKLSSGLCSHLELGVALAHTGGHRIQGPAARGLRSLCPGWLSPGAHSQLSWKHCISCHLALPSSKPSMENLPFPYFKSPRLFLPLISSFKFKSRSPR